MASAARIRICPSLLASDMSAMATDAQRVLAAGADWLHLDVMDGHFVPNLTFGAPVVKCLRKHTPAAFFDCHLMVSKPAQWVSDFGAAGADMYTFHIEAAVAAGDDVPKLCQAIRDAGMKVGMAVKPGTPVEAMSPYLSLIDMALVMTVEPGFGGQSFMPDMMAKVSALRSQRPDLDIQVDGGLSAANIDIAASAGANVIVAGSATFAGSDPAIPIGEMRAKAVSAFGAPAVAPAAPAAVSSGSVAAALSPQDALKREVGYRSIDDHVRSGMVVGLGTGSTAYFMVERLGAKLASGELEGIVGIPTSNRTAEQAMALGISLSTLASHPNIDVCIDGADAVDANLNIIKGGGGAHLREKMVAEAAARLVVIVDESKMCESLGPSFPLPVEVTPFGHLHTLRRIGQLPSLSGSAAAPYLRQLKAGGLYTTDNGNYIVDVVCGKPIADTVAVAAELSRLTGVVAHGLFNQMASEVIVAGKDGVSVIKRQ